MSAELGPVHLSFCPLLSLKVGQSRRSERGLVVPNERAGTMSEPLSRATFRAVTPMAPSGVIVRLCRMTTLRSLCLAGAPSGSQQRTK